MSSKLNLFFAEGDDDHVVEYGFKFNGDFIMIEKFDNHREHLQEPLEIPSVDWEVQITIKKEDLTINQIEDHKNLLDEGKKVDITETILNYFNEQTKQDMKDCGVAGSSVVLKSEFTTHTKENIFGEESYTKTITTQNERTCDNNRLYKTTIHLRHRLIKGI